MDSVREEVFWIAWGAAEGAMNDGEVSRADISEHTDAIMSAFKRASGVVDAKEITGEIDGQDLLGWLFLRLSPFTDDEDEATELASQIELEVESRIERITSAVEPSCVVTDAFDPDIYNPGIADPITDAIAELWARDFGINDEDEEYDPKSPAWAQFCEGQVDRGYGAHGKYWELSAITSWAARALTAALSSRTEEEVRADELERLARSVEEGETMFAAWFVRDFKTDGLGDKPAPINMPLADWLRSLTNGGG